MPLLLQLLQQLLLLAAGEQGGLIGRLLMVPVHPAVIKDRHLLASASARRATPEGCSVLGHVQALAVTAPAAAAVCSSHKPCPRLPPPTRSPHLRHVRIHKAVPPAAHAAIITLAAAAADALLAAAIASLEGLLLPIHGLHTSSLRAACCCRRRRSCGRSCRAAPLLPRLSLLACLVDLHRRSSRFLICLAGTRWPLLQRRLRRLLRGCCRRRRHAVMLPAGGGAARRLGGHSALQAAVRRRGESAELNRKLALAWLRRGCWRGSSGLRWLLQGLQAGGRSCRRQALGTGRCCSSSSRLRRQLRARRSLHCCTSCGCSWILSSGAFVNLHRLLLLLLLLRRRRLLLLLLLLLLLHAGPLGRGCGLAVWDHNLPALLLHCRRCVCCRRCRLGCGCCCRRCWLGCGCSCHWHCWLGWGCSRRRCRCCQRRAAARAGALW